MKYVTYCTNSRNNIFCNYELLSVFFINEHYKFIVSDIVPHLLKNKTSFTKEGFTVSYFLLFQIQITKKEVIDSLPFLTERNKTL